MGSKGHDKSITKQPNDDNDKPNSATMFIIIILVITLVLKTTFATLTYFPQS
jgi:hypothetical protein